MFKDNARHYWAAGLPAMPLKPTSKMPALNSWQTYGIQMPTIEEQERWLQHYSNGNIGLPLGACSGVVGLDLDSVDPRVENILNELLPPSPWTRVGKKGYVKAFKYNGERTYRIKDSEKKTILELLSKGAQIVLPPSIHPDTMLPYQSDTNLYEVMDRLVPLPANFEEKVRQALIAAGFELESRGSSKATDWVPAGGRDSAMTSMAGIYARDVTRGGRTLLEAIGEIETFMASFTENVAGDPLDFNKGRQKVMEFVRRDVIDGGKVLPKGWDLGMTTSDVKDALKYFGGDVEAWTYEEFMDFLQSQFLAIPIEDAVARTKVIDGVLIRIAKTDILTAIEADRVTQFIIQANGRNVTAGAIRKRIQELKGRELTGNDHTEIAQALMQELEAYGEVRNHQTKFWQWKGAHWEELDTSSIIKSLAENYGSLPAARKHGDHKGIILTMGSLVQQGLKSGHVKIGINFANGYLTSDMELLPHEPRFGATYTLPYRYAPGAAAPSRFLGFLDMSWGHQPDYLAKLSALQQAIAVTLFGMAPTFQRAFCLYGKAHTGKSVLMTIIKSLIPTEAQCNVSPHDFGDRFMPAQLAGKLLNFAGELSETSMIDGEKFKLIVEGSEMSGQLKGKDIFTFAPTCAHWFATNHLPRTRDTSEGFTRRWLIFNFDRVVKPDEKIRNFGEDVVADEREAIVAWALQCVPDLMKNQDIIQPASHVELMEGVAQQNNSARYFLRNGSVKLTGEASDKMRFEQIYAQYCIYCRASALSTPVAQPRFKSMLAELADTMGLQTSLQPIDGLMITVYHGIKIHVAKKLEPAI